MNKVFQIGFKVDLEPSVLATRGAPEADIQDLFPGSRPRHQSSIFAEQRLLGKKQFLDVTARNRGAFENASATVYRSFSER